MQFRLTLRLAGLMLILPALFTADEDQFVENMEERKNETAESDALGPPLGEEDFKDAESIDDQDPLDPEQVAELIVDDILPDSPEPASDYNARRGRNFKWPNAYIPYEITNQFSRNERNNIAQAIKMFQDKTCIRIRPRRRESSYIRIKKYHKCESNIGRQGGRQDVGLDTDCARRPGIIAHEFMHAAGFYHEQSRSDRDHYVRIIWDNIEDDMKHNFHKQSKSRIDDLNAPYDICSIMHYGSHFFSKNRRPTIVSKKRSSCPMGEQKNFSYWDIRKLNTLYKCNGYPQVNSRRTG